MGCGNCRAVETVEKRTACFPTISTALGKLAAEFSTQKEQKRKTAILGA
jgi:hypothetical protein